MALRRTLELLQTGERINDEMYRWTVDGGGTASAYLSRPTRPLSMMPTRLNPWSKHRALRQR